MDLDPMLVSRPSQYTHGAVWSIFAWARLGDGDRAGWTWYSGSAAWLYRAGLEAVLGLQLHGDQLRIDPCIPKQWPGFELTYLRRGRDNLTTRYKISVENPRHVCRGVTRMELDGHALAAVDSIALTDDGRTHSVRVVLG